MAYRGAIIGLGWMGMLYDLAQRMGEWHVDDIDRPTPELDIHRRFPYHSCLFGKQHQLQLDRSRGRNDLQLAGPSP